MRYRLGDQEPMLDGSVLHADPGFPLTVGDDVTVGHKAMLHGCTIGANTLIGIGSTILNGAVVGENCIVGAHALVTENKEFPDGSLIVGAPARIVRQLSSDETAQLQQGADHYVANAARFREELVEIV